MAKAVITSFSVKADRAEVAWRSVVPKFGDAKGCSRCHTEEHALLISDEHSNIGCQSCHGSLAEHDANPEIAVDIPNSKVCARCHVKTIGQPSAFHTIIPAKHYVATCLACHNPHSTQAKHPPIVSHPIKNLPKCITCHGPEKFRRPSLRHPDVTAQEDKLCLECHKSGSGPEMGETDG